MASWLFYIAVFLKQFYIFPSGNLGIADLFFAAACVMTFYGAWKNRTKLFYREDIPWVIFLIFVAIINGIYFIRTSNREFPLHTMYWIYSDMDVPDIVFRWLYAWFVLDLPHQYGISAACSVLWAWALFP